MTLDHRVGVRVPASQPFSFFPLLTLPFVKDICYSILRCDNPFHIPQRINNLKLGGLIMKFHFMLILMLIVLVPLQSQTQSVADDLAKNLQIVDKVQAVPEPYRTGFDSITLQDAEAFLRFISSDLLEGRDTGSSGFAVASEYAASLFASWGLLPAGDIESSKTTGMFAPSFDDKGKTDKKSYFQFVPLREKTTEKSNLFFTLSTADTRSNIEAVEGIDYFLQSVNAADLEAPIVFIGYGLNAPDASYNDFQGIDVKGKVVLMIDGKPESKKNEKRMHEIEKMMQDNGPQMRRRAVSNQIKAAQQAGALAVITVSADSAVWLNSLKPAAKPADSKPILDFKGRSIALAMDEGMAMPWEMVPRIRISPQLADQLLKPYGYTLQGLKNKIDDQLKPNSFAMQRTRVHLLRSYQEKSLQCRNVLAFLEGTDPELKKQLVVVGAHLDHLGKDGPYIFNGADDNGSGSVVVLQTAKAMMLNPKRPKRSVLFALWTGEEKGLLGSRFYVSHPLKPMKETSAYINIDMASRTWSRDSLAFMARMMRLENADKLIEKIDVNKFATFSFFENAQIAEILKKSNEQVGLDLLLRATRNSMGGSDHWPFGNADVPWVFLGGAMTEDYHQPGDEVEKCSFQQMQAFARICYLTVAQLTDV